jgi:hypothetical protein
MTTRKILLAARLCARALPTTTPQQQSSFRFAPAHKEGRRSAERRIQPMSAPHIQTLPPECARARKRADRSALAFRRFAAALVPATERQDSAQAALHASGRTQALPAPPIALKRSTPRAGRHAGGDDARTARERGYKPHPQEPHSLRDQVCLEITSLDERDSFLVTSVKGRHYSEDTLISSSSWGSHPENRACRCRRRTGAESRKRR